MPDPDRSRIPFTHHQISGEPSVFTVEILKSHRSDRGAWLSIPPSNCGTRSPAEHSVGYRTIPYLNFTSRDGGPLQHWQLKRRAWIPVLATQVCVLVLTYGATRKQLADDLRCSTDRRSSLRS